MNRLRVVFVGILLVGITGCGGNGTDDSETSKSPKLTPVTLGLNWFPEIEHGGFYTAQREGYYAEVGLDVTIEPGGPEAPVVQRVGAKQIEFCVSNADRTLMARSEGIDVVAVMAALRDSPRCIIVHEESGIEKLEDLKDLTLAMSDAAAFSFFLRDQLPLTNVRQVRYGGSIAPFMENKEFAIQGYVFSEPILIKNAGGAPKVFKVSDLGFNPYSSCVLTHAETIAEDPELVERFVSASLRGWRKYLEEPEATNRHIQSLNKEFELEVLNAGVEKLKPLCLPEGMDADQLGAMSAERWRTLFDQLAKLKLVENSGNDFRAAFDTRFVTR